MRPGKIVVSAIAAPLILGAGLGTALAAPRISLVTPHTLGAQPMVTDPAITGDLPKQKADLLRQVPGSTVAVLATYGNQSTGDLTLIEAVAAPVGNRQAQLDAFFSGFSAKDTAVQPVSGRVAVNPGPLGGLAECGNITGNGHSGAVCAWVDAGSIGSLVWNRGSEAEAARQFVADRGQIEQAG